MRCLYTSAREEAERYRPEPLASPPAPTSRAPEEVCVELDQAEAVSRWNQERWWPWVCQRYLEHVLGITCWRQFEAEDFGVLGRLREVDAHAAELGTRADATLQTTRWPDSCRIAHEVETWLEHRHADPLTPSRSE
jgi:hypothetical protein